MIGIEEKLTKLVDELRRTCREDDWWDFKETHYEDRAALLHDMMSKKQEITLLRCRQ